MRRTVLGLAAALLLLAAGAPALAVEPDEMLEDPALEARARDISQDLRCLVCQNQSIDDSSAPLARDLRILLRERLAAGDSDEKAVAYIVERYGDYVLLKPPFKATTLLLWLGPALALLLGALLVARLARHRHRPDATAAAELSDEEQARLAELLHEHGEDRPAR